ncbi:putative Ras GTPase [Vibrio nigripulchritudo SOn1]|uniref:Ras GTPase n=1 Tax=Vibrio nigripulchritudo SOn1 TaxID=1238450 RepID=A0AAV2VT30_9VIBR|nr:Rab family GTPase [Vibrio nigripulchritudo]CCO47796.1 putative Ras GTPase [Vibrio nigripulchritudo SOn1]
MKAKKICMIGAFAVGKTSLVRRYVESIFTDKYHTTIGVKISKKYVDLSPEPIQLLLWDLEGKDVYTNINTSYLRGASGAMLVVDGTRPDSLDVADELRTLIVDNCGDIPITLMLNKCDLEDQWSIGNDKITRLEEKSSAVFKCSAKSGQNVDEAFQKLAEIMLERD